MAEVSKLKQELNGEILVPASFQLLRTLMRHDPIDRLRLRIFPVVLGAGERPLGETNDKKPMRLVNAQTLGDRVAILTYEAIRHALEIRTITPFIRLPYRTSVHKTCAKGGPRCMGQRLATCWSLHGYGDANELARPRLAARTGHGRRIDQATATTL
jgi:hypothetical protein